MKEISNIKLHPFKALKKGEIENLGKINIFCGKNNSGKTTLLDTLFHLENNFLGETIIENKLRVFENAWSSNAQRWKFNLGGGSILFDSLFEVFEPLSIISEIFKEREIWYSDELPAFVEKFTELILRKIEQESREVVRIKHNQYLKQANALESWKKGFTSIFETCFVENFPKFSGKVFLIYPKRTIQNPITVAPVEFVSQTGDNIIGRLFELKNKLTGTLEINLYHEIEKAFEVVSDGYSFDLELQQNNLFLFFSRKNKKEWINASDSGLGLQDLLIILYFSLEHTNSIVLIEEPENHIHPEMQRRLIRFLSEESHKQYFITTHSNIFLNTTYANRIFFTSLEKGEIKISDATKKTEILNELGYSVSDNLVSDLIILVEGPTDTPIIEEYLKKFGIDATYNIKIWALGGDIMSQLDLSVFAERYRVIALIDKDPQSDTIRKKFIAKCKELEIPVTRLNRYAIENYFSVRALRAIFKAQIPAIFTNIDPDISLEKQININVKNNNRKLAQEMTLEEIEGTDLHEFFQKVQKVCES